MASDDRSLKEQGDVHSAGAAPDAETTRRPKPAATAVAHSMFVLGMHRSGTSAIARVLNFMGAYVGETQDLMPPHARDNPAGYWERRELVIAHDNFLHATGHAWDRVAGFDAS